MSINIFEAPIRKITRIQNDSTGFRDRGEGDQHTKTIRIQIDVNSGASSVVGYNGYENILNARINELPSLVHSTNDCVVISQLLDAAYFKDGIFRRFYFYFLESSDAQKFCNLYNRESSMVKTIKELRESMRLSETFKDAPVCRLKDDGRPNLSCREDVLESTFTDAPDNESVSDCGSNHDFDDANNDDNKSGVEYEDVEELLGGLGFEDNTQTWPQEPLKPFGNFK